MKSDNVFKLEVQDQLDDLFHEVRTWKRFWSNLRQIPVQPHTYEHALQFLMETIAKYKGLVTEYQVISGEPDKLVHGEGINSDGNRCAFGAVYVLEKDEDVPLTQGKDKITSFLTHAQRRIKDDADPSLPQTMFLFSNCTCLHKKTREQFIEWQGLSNAVVVYTRPEIESIVNGDDYFWDFAMSMLIIDKESMSKREPRPFQIEAINSVEGISRCQILAPTGTGKTLIEDCIAENVIRKAPSPVIVIAGPRILLAFQHLDEISAHLASRGIDADYLNLNSGSMDANKIKHKLIQWGLLARDVPSTTSPHELLRHYKQCQLDGRPLVISSTYQSVGRLLEADIPIDLLICDEAHNLVRGIGRFSLRAQQDAHKVSRMAKQSIFVTATPGYSPLEKGSGMQNEKLFGKVAYRLTPKQALDLGEIVAPYLVDVEITNAVIKKHKKFITVASEEWGDFTDIDSIVVVESYLQLKKLHEMFSAHPEKMGVKLLVIFKGEESFRAFFNSQYVNEWAVDNNMKLFGVSSASGAYLGSGADHIPARQSNFKETAYMKLRKEPDTANMILGHIDMLGEGIDLPRLLGMLPLRDLGEIKVPQTLGRIMRLFLEDRIAFYNGTLNTAAPPGSEDRKAMIKPYAWVLMPIYDDDKRDGRARIVKIARRMRADLGYTPYGMGINTAADGRNEQFQKDPRINGDEVDHLSLKYEIENPEYEQFVQQEIKAAQETPSKIMNLIKFER